MSYVHILKAFLKQFFFFGTLLFLFPLTTSAQVTIKEKISIKPTQLFSGKKLRGAVTISSVDSFFVMNKSGILKIYYGDAERLYSDFPPTLRLVVSIRNGTAGIDTFLSRFQSVPPFSESNQICTPSSWFRYYHGSATQPYVAGFVEEGDTVDLYCISDYHSINGVPDTLTINSYEQNSFGWNIILGGTFNPCVIDWNEKVSLFVGIDEPPNIMLGETKYYRAVLNATDSSKLLIEESSTPMAGGLTGITFTVDRDTTVSDSIKGKRLGAYYEYKNSSSGSLPGNQIRLVGKYWHRDSTYRAKLVVSMTGKSPDSMSIEVKSPKRLGSTYNRAYTIASPLDINVDSLVIQYAGKYGIPPQYLKGQMYDEAYKEAGNGGRFYPSYRYEPWQDLGFRTQKKKAYADAYMAHPFWVDSTGMDPSNVPTNHQNVRPIYYPTQPTTIGSFVVQNYGQYTSGSGKKGTLSDSKMRHTKTIFIQKS